MAMSLDPDIIRKFPNLRDKTNHKINSSPSPFYNCFSLILGKRNNCWWPDPYSYWPSDCLDDTVEAFVKVLGTFGFDECEDGAFESGNEKVAIYANGNTTEHVALQRTTLNGKWVSKLGEVHDIIHELHALEDGDYGKVVKFLKRAKKNKPKGRRRSA